MTNMPYFSKESFRFLGELAAHNERSWFEANKKGYEQHLRAPALRLIGDLAAPLAQLSPHFVASAKPVGGSLFRQHRDTRFSADKRPYKTHVGITLYHAATRATARTDDSAQLGRLDAPVFYLHIEPEACLFGGGIWHPQAHSLRRIRDYLVSNARSWGSATRSPAFAEMFRLGGEQLKRPPQGYDPAHPWIDDLKRKDFVAMSDLDDALLCSGDLVAELSGRMQRLSPLQDWLCDALELPF
jgi:uncharacterized protein (TIGR02453 family)